MVARGCVAAAAARLDACLLPSRARRPLCICVLEHRLFHRKARPRLDVVELRQDHPRTGLSQDRVSNNLDGRRRHPYRRSHRSPFRLLHGPDRYTTGASFAVRTSPLAALVELPGTDLRVALDPQPGRRAELVAREPRPATTELGVHEHRDVDRLLVHLAPVHDPARLRGARTHPRLLSRGFTRHGCAKFDDVSAHHPAPGATRSRRRFDLHVLAYAW